MIILYFFTMDAWGIAPVIFPLGYVWISGMK